MAGPAVTLPEMRDAVGLRSLAAAIARLRELLPAARARRRRSLSGRAGPELRDHRIAARDNRGRDDHRDAALAALEAVAVRRRHHRGPRTTRVFPDRQTA